MNVLLEFSTKQNIQLLWEILLDELNIKTNNNLIQNIRNIFDANIKPFLSKANPNKTLINLNKDFLSKVIIAVNKLIPNLKQEQNIIKINITNEEVELPYTIENIQASRQNNFERELSNKQKEFETIINPPKPQSIDFSFKEKDTKISQGEEMEKLIAQTIYQRNYDIQQIKNNNNEKSDNEKNDNNLIERENVDKTNKKVSWDDTEYLITEQNNNDINNDDDDNILNNLKKILNNNNNIENVMDEDDKPTNNIYIEIRNINTKLNEIYNLLQELVLKNNN
jgi:hypothetical protein